MVSNSRFSSFSHQRCAMPLASMTCHPSGVFALFYFGFILIFALIYYWISLSYPMCVNSNGSAIGDGEGARIFGDCFHLSWTTFSTVVSLDMASHTNRMRCATMCSFLDLFSFSYLWLRATD